MCSMVEVQSPQGLNKHSYTEQINVLEDFFKIIEPVG